ncbi:MAG TPA: AGE family epimerase/isomerase [Terriglobia bacterium]|nr:AGE family epimerase/isomerase [Terriglobia bacterium]
MPINNSVRNTLLEIRERAVANLKDSVLPFWARAWDHEQGGFFGRLDRVGNVIDPSEKLLIKQVRMLYSLSAAHRFGIADRGYLELAHRGFDYITGTMWDNEEGGFYYSVNREGRPSSTRKNTDVHGYVLIGLSEYYLASQRKEALEWGNRVFNVLAEKAKDGERGYREEFDDGKWPVLNSEQMSLGDRNDIKTIDMHTNILEGLVYLCRASSDQKHRAALESVLRLIVDKGLHPEQCGITAFDFDWNPVPDVDGRWTTSYGLNAELAWLLLAAVDVLHHPRESYRRAILGLIDHSLRFGFDQQRGGVAAFGPLRGYVLCAGDLPARRLWKSWWAQAELLNALAYAYEWTREPGYLDALVKLFGWIWAYQIDHECGDWYQDVYWDSGKPLTTEKGGEWKTAFHASRALIQTSQAIDRIVS